MTVHSESKSIYILGSGGHAKVILDIFLSKKTDIIGLLDIKQSIEKNSVWGINIFSEEITTSLDPASTLLVNGVGGGVNLGPRSRLYEQFHERSFVFLSVFAPSAEISSRSNLGEGVQILHGAIIQASCEIGRNVIVNTRALIDHDCKIADHVHIAPGAILCGGVSVGEHAFIGAGAVVLPGKKIGKNAVVGAGAVVVHDVEDGQTAIGNPARKRVPK